jgi:hypothetical protein
MGRHLPFIKNHREESNGQHTLDSLLHTCGSACAEPTSRRYAIFLESSKMRSMPVPELQSLLALYSPGSAIWTRLAMHGHGRSSNERESWALIGCGTSPVPPLPIQLKCLDESSVCHNFCCLEVCLTGTNTPPHKYEILYFLNSMRSSLFHLILVLKWHSLFTKKKLKTSPFKQFTPHFTPLINIKTP